MVRGESPFRKMAVENGETGSPFEQKSSRESKSPFQQKSESEPFQESTGKSFLRSALQIPLGLAQATIPGIIGNVWNLLAQGEMLDPEELDHLEMIAKREGFPFDREEYTKLAHKVSQTIPTPSNIASEVESRTGLPITPKTTLQKAIQLGSSAAGFTPGSLSQKATSAAIAPSVSTGLQATGVPEPFAELAGLAAVGSVGTKASPINAAISPKQKPSGLVERRFEALEKPREVSQKKFGQINEKLEADFKKISQDIIEKSPIEKTYKEVGEKPSLRSQFHKQFEKVEDLAEKIETPIESKVLKDNITKNLEEKKGFGYSPSEYDKDFNNFMNEFIENIGEEKLSAANGVKQYRKNNKSLTEYYDPGRSKAYNEAKKDALLEYNRAIANTFEESFPNSEFSNFFKETNKKYSEIMDVEAINKFINKATSEKINYKELEKFFENKNIERPFKRALGEKGFSDFKQLMEDMLSTKKPMQMLQVAKKKGKDDLVKSVTTYLISPKLGTARTTFKLGQSAFKKVMNTLLDKPQLVLNWKKGVENLSKGNFKEAEKEFKILDQEVKSKQDALKKFNEKLIQNRQLQKPSKASKEELKQEVKPIQERKSEAVQNKKKDIEDRISRADERIKKADELLKKNPENMNAKTLKKESEKLLSNGKKMLNDLEKEGSALIKSKEYEARSSKQKIKHKTEPKKIITEKDWEYTKEDFPTKKEAQKYLDHLKNQLKKTPEHRKHLTEKNIRNLEYLVNSF